MSDGGTLATKGLTGGIFGGVAPVVPVAVPPTPQTAPFPGSTPTGSVVIVIPTSPNVVLMVAQNIATNLRANQAANLVLPSLYKRAFLMANETDEIAVVMP